MAPTDVRRGSATSDVVVPRNAADLALERLEYFDVIDGLAREDLLFAGVADKELGDAASGDILQDSDYQVELLEAIAVYREAELPVCCVDYALDPENAATARATAERAGCVSFVSQTPLDRLPAVDGSGRRYLWNRRHPGHLHGV